MKIWVIATLCVVAVVLFSGSAFAQPADDDAKCSVSATVANMTEWSDFSAMNLETTDDRDDQLMGSDTTTLYTKGNVDITAENDTDAELSEPAGGDTHTEYSLSYDGDGSSATGSSTVSYTVYSSFLGSASTVTHVDADEAVVVTLGARATNAAGTLADSGDYSATLTLTLSWGTE
ncbi:MAG: hypothetical protein KAJ01_07385 [Candidatus Hydrogenedentes bacterium]|nr:hypothetical protein [Candidatus Hydrogenedentota bacterium]